MAACRLTGQSCRPLGDAGCHASRKTVSGAWGPQRSEPRGHSPSMPQTRPDLLPPLAAPALTPETEPSRIMGCESGWSTRRATGQEAIADVLSATDCCQRRTSKVSEMLARNRR
ncbi:MAG: hypothetical protein MZV63_32970 [Marinilabiliales bacterium]|nr:hypothetical protein [Marinilabiliales bacterium]